MAIAVFGNMRWTGMVLTRWQRDAASNCFLYHGARFGIVTMTLVVSISGADLLCSKPSLPTNEPSAG